MSITVHQFACLDDNYGYLVRDDGTVVIEFRRTFMCYRRSAPEVTEIFPDPRSDWTV